MTENNWAVEKAVEITKAAIGSAGETSSIVIAKKDEVADFMETVYERLVTLMKKD